MKRYVMTRQYGGVAVIVYEGTAVPRDLLEQNDPSPADYLPVKRALIATLPEKGGVITEDQVIDVLFGRLEELEGLR